MPVVKKVAAKKNLSSKAIAAIENMIAFIKANPKLVNQNRFPNVLDCGSACCAAGHLIAQNKPTHYKKLCKLGLKWAKEHDEITESSSAGGIDWAAEAAKVIGIELTNASEMDYHGLGRIFGTVWTWPHRFSNRYENAATDRGRAAAFAARWRAFIESDTKDLEYGYYKEEQPHIT